MNDIALALGLGIQLLTQGSSILETLRTAQAEGRSTLTPAEWAQMQQQSASIHEQFTAALAAAAAAAADAQTPPA